jgi:AraC family transcriptional regulator of adaptative response/methylated-DNA-[protein]-cysteine methyltransferase
MQQRSIAWTIAETSLGRLLVAATERGVCHVRFGESEEELEMAVRHEFPFAPVRRDDARVARFREALVARVEGVDPDAPIPVDVSGSAFQRRVWDALLRIPAGRTRSYADVAASLGQPRAARAVARACAANPVAVVIPCHRVVPRSGDLGGYRWGTERKCALLERERALEEAPRPRRDATRAASGA